MVQTLRDVTSRLLCNNGLLFVGGYQAEIVQNHMNDASLPTKWISSLTKESLYYLNMK